MEGSDMKEDKTIEEIRSVRRKISQECGNDPHRLVEHYIRRQEANARKLRKSPKRSSLRQES
jgi:hypothetical protein